MKPRQYQTDSINKTFEFLKNHKDKNPCIVIPTGGGKSIVIAKLSEFFAERNMRVLILGHRKELLLQIEDKIKQATCVENVGVACGTLNRREISQKVVIASINTAYSALTKVPNWGNAGDFSLIIVDEAHMIQKDEGMFNAVIKAIRDNNKARLIGLTATPYRTGEGMIVGDDCMFDQISYQASIDDLQAQGYLSQIVSRDEHHNAIDTSGVKKQGGDFNLKQLATAAMADEDKLINCCKSIVLMTKHRNMCLVFAVSVEHAYKIQRHIDRFSKHLGQRSEVLHGKLNAEDRDKILADYHAGKVKYLINVNILTVGFDSPQTDCIVCCRPTTSPGLWYQVCGRGFRIHPDKKDCLVLDFGGNCQRFGLINDDFPAGFFGGEKIGNGETMKRCSHCGVINDSGDDLCIGCGKSLKAESSSQICPQCNTENSAKTLNCGECDYEFWAPEITKDAELGQIVGNPDRKIIPIGRWSAHRHISNAGDDMVRVDYYTDSGTDEPTLFNEYKVQSEFFNFQGEPNTMLFKKGQTFVDNCLARIPPEVENVSDSLIELLHKAETGTLNNEDFVECKVAGLLKECTSITIEPQKRDPKFKNVLVRKFSKSPIELAMENNAGVLSLISNAEFELESVDDLPF